MSQVDVRLLDPFELATAEGPERLPGHGEGVLLAPFGAVRRARGGPAHVDRGGPRPRRRHAWASTPPSRSLRPPAERGGAGGSGVSGAGGPPGAGRCRL